MKQIVLATVLLTIFSSCLVSKKKFDDVLAQKVRTEADLADRNAQIDKANADLKDLNEQLRKVKEDRLWRQLKSIRASGLVPSPQAAMGAIARD